jgi:hypothetical protein
MVGQSDDGAVFVRSMLFNSLNAFYGGDDTPNIPGSGEAFMEIAGAWHEIKKRQVDFVSCYGMAASSYEGGWATGGDKSRTPFMDYMQYEEPRTAQAEVAALNAWAVKGGVDFQHHYTLMPNLWNSEGMEVFENWKSYPLIQGTLRFNSQLPPEVSEGGHELPATLTPDNFDVAAAIYDWTTNPAKDNNGGVLDATKKDGTLFWFAWDVIAPRSANYQVTLDTEPGGTYALFLNGTQLVAEGDSGDGATLTIPMTKGLHNLKLRVTSGSFKVNRVSVD